MTKTFAIGSTFDGAQFASLYGLNSYGLDANSFFVKNNDVGQAILYCPDSVPDAPTLTFAHVDTPDEKMKKAAVTAAITALEAGTATNAQVQNVLAKVLRYLRRENF